MKPIRQEFVFGSDYDVDVLEEWPSGGGEVWHSYPGTGGGSDGLCIRIEPHSGEPWIGLFAFGDPSEQLASGVWSHPDPSIVCVAARGKAYFVNVHKPTEWSEADAFPVTAVVPVASESLLVFADFSRIAAYSRQGLVWRTDHVSWDGITVTAVEQHRLFGLGHDSTIPGPVEFSVDLRSGATTGGSNPMQFKRR